MRHNIIKNTILCLRFPFLYPRNRWSGKHYNNWGLLDKCKDIWAVHHVFNWVKPGSLIDQYKGKKYYYKKEVYESGLYTEQYWKNPIACWRYSALMWIHDNLLQWIHCIPTYTELDAMPEGWRKAFGIQMCKEIKKELIKTGLLYKYRIVDIKEKYGELRWYDNGAPVNVNKIIHKYEYISRRTCIRCGELATCQTPIEYWASPYCDECFPKQSLYKLDYGIYDNWYGYTGNINGRSQEEHDKLKEQYEEYEKTRT